MDLISGLQCIFKVKQKQLEFFFPQVFFHTDAAQAVGKIPVDVNDMKIDLG